MRYALFLLAVLSLIAISVEFAHTHSGGLDKYGCHEDKQRGGYHCHEGDGKSSSSGCSFF